MLIHAAIPVALLLAPAIPAAGQGIQPMDEAGYRRAISGKEAICRFDEPMRASIMTYDEEVAARHYAEFFPATPLAGSDKANEATTLLPLLAARVDAAAATWANLFRFFQDEWPYRTLLLSPYCDLEMRVRDAALRKRPFKPETFDPTASQFVVIRVGPNSYFEKADSIKSLFLKRDGKVIEAAKTELTPQVLDDATKREVVTGRFWFPVEAFIPGSNVTLVYVGPTRNWEWTFTSEELIALQ